MSTIKLSVIQKKQQKTTTINKQTKNRNQKNYGQAEMKIPHQEVPIKALSHQSRTLEKRTTSFNGCGFL